jgi:hypothetical protein
MQGCFYDNGQVISANLILAAAVYVLSEAVLDVY